MLPVFSNVLGFYALLGIPAVLAIHFLQHKSKKVRTSTLFLIEALTPESRTGRVWERIRNSMSLWMQILCILLLTWVITKPRWLQENSWQTVVFIMDDSMRMQAFKNEAIRAVSRDIDQVTRMGIPTHWVVMGSSSRRAPLYRGDEAAKVLEILNNWEPKAGEHDPVPAMRTAQAIISGNGASRYITHSEQNIPQWQPSIGVGKVIDNVGFVGLIPEEQAGEDRWRVAIKNNSSKPQQRELEINIAGNTGKQLIQLNPGAVTELKVALPPEINSMELRLTADGYTKDDVLPLVRNSPKHMGVSISTDPKPAAYLKKLVDTIPGAAIVPGDQAHVRIIETDDAATLPSGNLIALSRRGEQSDALPMVTAETHYLTRDLSWGGLLFSGTGILEPALSGQILLWSGDRPIAWLQRQSLVLNWAWNSSNADRIPATALLLRRYLEQAQSRIPGYWSANIAAGSKLHIPGAAMMRFSPVAGEKVEKPYAGTMPDDTGFVEIFGDKEMKTPLFNGATYPPDARQGDFSHCSSFETGDLNQQNTLEKISKPDPLVPLWLALAGAALMAAWIPGKQERKEEQTS